jgi:amidase
MNLSEYTSHDALGLADLVARKQVTPRELAALAAQAIAAVNPQVGAVVETYPDRIDGLDEATLGSGPFRGVPFLMKDVFGHEAGRTVEFGSRLCKGMVAQEDSVYCKLVRPPA